MTAPREIKTAIALSVIVLVLEATENLWRVASDSEASVNTTFGLLWIAVAFAANALTALFIFQAARRRNWARIALLVWTVGSWALWLFYPQTFEDYSVWAWLLAAMLFVMELVALYLLFRGKGGAWYSSAVSDAL